MTIGEAIRYGVRELDGASTTPELDAEMLLTFALGRGAHSHDVFVLTHPEVALTSGQEAAFTRFMSDRRTGKPIAYIVGVKEFYGREFMVDARVLVPRPATELLIDAVKKYCVEHGIVTPRIVDIGTGSGCIAVTLALELPGARVTATDISEDALVVARQNATTLNAQNIAFARGDVFEALDIHEPFDIIVSNPPYVDMQDVDLSAAESQALQHEPRNALTPPEPSSAFSVIEKIITQSSASLAQPGLLCIEIGHDQGNAARTCAQQTFPNATVRIEKDLEGFDRVVVVEQK